MIFLVFLLACCCVESFAPNVVYQFANVNAKYSEGLSNLNATTLCALEYLGMVWQTSANDVWLSIGNYSVVKYRHPDLLELPPWFQPNSLPKVEDTQTLDSLLLSYEFYDPSIDYCQLVQQLRANTIQSMEEIGPVEFLMISSSSVTPDVGSSFAKRAQYINV